MKTRLFQNTAFLGIAVGERTLTLAEVAPPARGPTAAAVAGKKETSSAEGSDRVVRRVAEFTIPTTGAAGDEIEEAGAALAAFLREHEFTASRTVIGFPARWLVAREKELPPSEDEEAAEILRLQAERSFSSELGELAIDYAGAPDSSAATNVLLLGIPRRQLDRIAAICRRAGLDVRRAMPSTLALGAIAPGGGGDDVTVNATSDAVELSIARHGSPRLLRHLAVRGPDLGSTNGSRQSAIASLTGELKRTVAMLPRGGVNGASKEGSLPVLHLWDGVGLGTTDAASLARNIGARLQPSEGLSGLRTKVSLDANAIPNLDKLRRFAPAVALAIAGTSGNVEQTDFLHPRLVKRRPSRFGKRQQWYIGVGGGFTLLLLILFGGVQYQQWRLDRVNDRIENLRPNVQTAKATNELISNARGWYDSRPGTLECFRDLTSAFPDGSIYLTSFVMKDTGEVVVQGKTTDRSKIETLSKNLKANKKFIKITAPSEVAAGNAKDVTFNLSFTYVGGIE